MAEPTVATKPPTPPENAGHASVAAQGDRDPLASLHKMSTTAGLGSQEYVAINPLSIVAILLGLCSALVMLNEILLVVPIAGVICGVAAWRQIRRSNGTQSGLGLATAGIVLSIALAGFDGAKNVATYMQRANDRKDIAALITRFSGMVQTADKNPDRWKDVYQLFDSTFQQRESESAFINRWKSLQNTMGAIASFRWNGADPYFEKDPGTGDLKATALVVLQFKNSSTPEGRYPMVFLKVGQTWMVDDFPILFPQQQPGGPGGPGGAGGPPGH